MASHRASPVRWLVLLIATAMVVSNACDSQATTTATHDRHVRLEGQPSFRDLGGYETADGRRVKWGQIYRSGELPSLNDENVAHLTDLEIKTVVNFLIAEETAAKGPDRLPAGVREVAQPIDAGGRLVEVVNEARRTADFSVITPDLNPEFHRLLVDKARQQYASLFR